MPTTRYATQTLLGILSNIKRPKRFLLEKFFTTERTFTTEEVLFDKILQNRRLAPFVSPYVKGKPMPRAGESLVAYRPPYLKPKHVLTPDIAIKTMPGESLDGELTPQQRMDRVRAQMLQDQDDQITRREEWMGSTLLRTGTLSIVAEDHPPMTINLGRPAGHTVTLTSTARWGQAGVSPFQNLRTWATMVAAASGSAPTEVVMDPLAAALLLSDPAIIANMQIFHQPNRDIDLLGQLAVPDEAQYLGSLGGFNFYQYSSTFLNADGSVGQFMPAYTVILGSPGGAQGVRCYGAILDINILAASRYPKEWVEQDPAAHFLMTQSAPLPLLGWPEATMCATVN